VGYCQAGGVSDQGFPCDNTRSPPFWWQVVTDQGARILCSYDNQPLNQQGVSGNGSNLTSVAVSCSGRAGRTLRVDVDTRDANGNIVGGPPWSNVRSASATCPLTAPAADSVTPLPPTVSAVFDAAKKALVFSWKWAGDRTCAGCMGPVGYCQPTGTSSAGFPCDNLRSPPFWWQVVTDQGVRELNSYTNEPANQKGVSGNSSNATSWTVSCAGRAGRTLRVDVQARDANGNIQGGPPWSDVRSAAATCPAA
jgi:hypothetical protein